MRVLQLNSVYLFGSTGRIARDLQLTLREQGGEGAVAFGRKQKAVMPDGYRFGQPMEFMEHVAYSLLTGRHGFASKAATSRLLAFIESYQPEIIHLHNIHGFYINIKVLFDYLKKTKIPVVWTLHDCWAMTGHCAHFEYIHCNKWQSGCHHCPQLNHYPYSLMDASRHNYTDKKQLFTSLPDLTLVTPSNWLANLVQQSFLQSYPVHVINNGIDLDLFQETPSDFAIAQGLQDKRILLAVAGTWTKRKGLSDLVRLESLLNTKEHLVIIGLTPAQRRLFKLQTLALPPVKSIKELAALYSAADVLINPTLEDNFPTVNLEALACGTPVATYATGGSPETIDAQTGRVVPQGDIHALLQAGRDLLHQDRAVIRLACRERAMNHYNRQQTFSRYIDLYQQILEGKS